MADNIGSSAAIFAASTARSARLRQLLVTTTGRRIASRFTTGGIASPSPQASIISPKANAEDSDYEKMEEAVKLCLLQAEDQNKNMLTFEDFYRLLKMLLSGNFAAAYPHLGFMLFDLDKTGYLDRNEFRELLRFFLNRNPTQQEFEEEWHRVVMLGNGGDAERVTLAMYRRWIRETDNPAIAQNQNVSASFLQEGLEAAQAGSLKDTRPSWNPRFNAGLSQGHVNEHRHTSKREYFVRPQSLPELKRFYEAYSQDFGQQQQKLARPLDSAATSVLFPKSLSSEVSDPLLMPKRHTPGGTMSDHTNGDTAIWEDHWMTPLRLRSHHKPGYRPLPLRATFGSLEMGVSTLRPSRSKWLQKSYDSHIIRPARETTFVAEPW